MAKPKAQTQQAQYLQDRVVATARALSARPQLHSRGQWFYDGDLALPLYAAHLSPDRVLAGEENVLWLRARADAIAQRLCFGDENLHQIHCPEQPIERMIFELLEQLRCESLAALSGVRHNLHWGFCDWSRHFSQSQSAQSIIGLLLLTLSQIVYSRLNACSIDEKIADLIESTRAGIAPVLGASFAALRRCRADQAAFIPHALNIAKVVSQSIDEEQRRQGQNPTTRQFSRHDFKLPLNFTPPQTDAFATIKTSLNTALNSADYSVWTRQYDGEKAARQLVRDALLREYRSRLDQAISDSKIQLSRLVRVFRSLIVQPQSSGWDFDQSSGYLDSRRLTQLVTKPSDHRIFKTLARSPMADCQVTLLLDCSGSMKNCVDAVAPFADIFARLFEMTGADSEVLGFTTQAWHGGRSAKDWVKQGRPENPGRLNETLHLLFKSSEQSYRRARQQLAALYKLDLFREGIDGEAIEWAIARLYLRPAKRRLLFVLSDGCPMDRATELANGGTQLLEKHLRQVIASHDGAGIEIYGLGLGLDLSLFYRHRLAFEPEALLSQQSFLAIAEMLDKRQHCRNVRQTPA